MSPEQAATAVLADVTIVGGGPAGAAAAITLARAGRDVVVVADPATVTLLLRVLAPDQLAATGPVTEVGLPRGTRPVPIAPALGGGAALALASGLLSAVVPVWVLPLLAVLAGLVLLAVPGRRHLGEAALIAVGVALLVSLLVIAGSSRFPGAW